MKTWKIKVGEALEVILQPAPAQLPGVVISSADVMARKLIPGDIWFADKEGEMIIEDDGEFVTLTSSKGLVMAKFNWDKIIGVYHCAPVALAELREAEDAKGGGGSGGGSEGWFAGSGRVDLN